MTGNEITIPDEVVINKILLIRNEKVMSDRDLAELYGVTTKRLNEQVKRNLKKFPPDFMFQLTGEEKEQLIVEFAHLKSLKFSSNLPFAFTEYGSVMLASVLNSDRAIAINVHIVKVFTELRKGLADNTELRLAMEQLSKKTDNNTKNIEVVFNYLDEVAEKLRSNAKRKPIGFKIGTKK